MYGSDEDSDSDGKNDDQSDWETESILKVWQLKCSKEITYTIPLSGENPNKDKFVRTQS